MSYQINEVLHAMIAAAPTPTHLGVRLIKRAAEEKGEDGDTDEDGATDADEDGATDADVDSAADAEKSGWSSSDHAGYEDHMATQHAPAAAAAANTIAAAAKKKNKKNKSRVEPARSSRNAEQRKRAPKRARRPRGS